MENASKALIIAGAILLSILIISLGIMVYNNAKNTVNNQNLDKQEVQTFNSEWETYVGDTRTASEVRTMIQAVIAHNGSETRNTSNRYIQVEEKAKKTASNTVSTAANAVTTAPNNITVSNLNNSTTYTIRTAYDNATGLVSKIYWWPNT